MTSLNIYILFIIYMKGGNQKRTIAKIDKIELEIRGKKYQ